MTPAEFIALGQDHMDQMQAQALQLTRNRTEAEDLLQEAAANAFRSRHTFQLGTNFIAWARTIIRNTFLNDVRRSKRRRDLLTDKPITYEWINEPTVINPAESHLTAEEIYGYITELPATFRWPFHLHVEGLTYKEISYRLGIPVGTAKSRVFTARQRLRRRIERTR